MPSLLVILIGLVLIGLCYCESCDSVTDCHSTNCKDYHHGNWILECKHHKCQCKETNACGTTPCLNGGTCHSTGTGTMYTCECVSGFWGTRCEHNAHCNKNPCHNGGTCSEDRHRPFYKCSCLSGYYGHACEHFSSACDSNPCVHGRCMPSSSGHGYTCRCRQGFSGDRCQAHECERHPCNNGTCYRTATSPHFACSCFTGYHGIHCQFESCKEVRCHHGGTCRPTVHSPFHTCSCLPGFQGTSCLHRVPHSTTTAKPALATINTDRVSPSTTTAKPALTTIKTGPACLACSNVVSPDTCENIVQCGIHEVCYVDQFVNSIGSFRFNLGCRDKAQCDVMQRGDSQNTASGQAADTPQLYVCTECCRNSLCNSGGCGEQGFQSFTSGQRGPICFKCEQQSSPNDCNKIRICGRDEVCMLNTTSVGTSHQMLWKSDCQKKSTCQHTGVISSNSGNGGCSKNCCSQDLCNNVC
ncbi:neurogenic locus notch homolog protein 2-like isoform X3 [Mercenaria mercenaria]|uniref:neurogenic locus notch homolog protein 2-like isoform X3 n=1 Tax=Mercenaria mercenaria TaxID=6596 RepID=UPI00234F8038|nr:neurogenic locus notch homolog protein 2-like isoform X3 [Mercenaria mercenaria]